MLGYERVAKTPTYVVASKTIADLQFPRKSNKPFKEIYYYLSKLIFLLIFHLRWAYEMFFKTLDRIVYKEINLKKWSYYRFGSIIKSECLYAGALVILNNWKIMKYRNDFILVCYFLGLCFNENDFWIGRGHRILSFWLSRKLRLCLDLNLMYWIPSTVYTTLWKMEGESERARWQWFFSIG
jgi:hypothetical protein